MSRTKVDVQSSKTVVSRKFNESFDYGDGMFGIFLGSAAFFTVTQVFQGNLSPILLGVEALGAVGIIGSGIFFDGKTKVKKVIETYGSRKAVVSIPSVFASKGNEVVFEPFGVNETKSVKKNGLYVAEKQKIRPSTYTHEVTTKVVRSWRGAEVVQEVVPLPTNTWDTVFKDAVALHGISAIEAETSPAALAVNAVQNRKRTVEERITQIEKETAIKGTRK